MSPAPKIVVKKNVKRSEARERPSHVRASGVAWISHLHKLWSIPRDDRSYDLHLTA